MRDTDATKFWLASILGGLCVGVVVWVAAAAALVGLTGDASQGWGMPVSLLLGAAAAVLTALVVRRIAGPAA